MRTDAAERFRCCHLPLTVSACWRTFFTAALSDVPHAAVVVAPFQKPNPRPILEAMAMARPVVAAPGLLLVAARSSFSVRTTTLTAHGPPSDPGIPKPLT